MKHYKKIGEYAFFYGGCFSQWYSSKFIDKKFKIEFSCAEQAMMYFKAILFNDKNSASSILRSKSPKIQKELGRQVIGFDPIVWNKHARDIVFRNNYFKFTQNAALLDILFETEGLTLVEASPYDHIWGIKRGLDYEHLDDPSTWRGTNWLGLELTRLRKHIKERKSNLDE